MPAKMARNSKAHHSAHCINVPGIPKARNSHHILKSIVFAAKIGDMQSLNLTSSISPVSVS